MARPTLENLRNVGDFAALYLWDISIIGSVPAALSTELTSEKINFRAESAELPKLTGQSIQLDIRGHRIKQPGIYNNQGVITFTFVEDVGNTVHQFFKTWRDLLWDQNTGARADSKQNLEVNFKIQRLDYSNTPIWFYQMKCFLEDYEPGGTLDGATSDFLKPSMTLSFDRFTDGAV